MAISILLVCTSQQIGSTYGGFSETAEDASTITFCSVFPNTIVQQLSEIQEHVHKAVALMDSLKGYSFSGSTSAADGIEDMSLEELDAAEQGLASRLSALHSEVSTVNGQLNNNAQTWNELIKELNAAASALSVTYGYMLNLDPNCLEIKDEQFLNELQGSISQSGVLSESLNASLNGVFHYLKSINDNDILFSRQVADAVYGPQNSLEEDLQQPFPFLVALQPEGNISKELITVYEGFNAELNNALSSAASEISQLENQREMLSRVRTQRLTELTELEKTKQAEEAKLALEQEKEQQAAESAAEAAPDKPIPDDPLASGTSEDITPVLPEVTPEVPDNHEADSVPPENAVPEPQYTEGGE